MENERQFDGIRIDGVPLADVLKDQRDNRVIMVRDKEVAVQVKCKKRHPVGKFVYRQHQKMFTRDHKPGKGRYLSRKELEEVKMDKEVVKINKEGLTIVEAIYVAFKENGWRELRNNEIAHATGIKLTSSSSVISKMAKDGMLEREQREPRKFYYKVSEDCQELGVVGWTNMYREADNRLKKEARQSKVKKPKKTKSLSKVVGNQPVEKEVVGNQPDDDVLINSAYKNIATQIHSLVSELGSMMQTAQAMGLQVDIIAKSGEELKSRVYKEF